jgi:hypothetical protein
MSGAQRILKALAAALHDNQISEDGCEALAQALNGVLPEYHMEALKALLGIEDNPF